MVKTNASLDENALSAQVFVLRVPGGSAPALVERVNDGAISQHSSLQEAFARIETLLTIPTPRTKPDRRH